ncbi:deoxycytidine triphosphate deaminase [Methanocaldococcus villosus KIN24-T80]|uniref:dCTP deaminase, dUMP-forming n=1 Tax=Methanocaldococcus villosus KIN24-T80 TaxID=1069083 RepID=N6V0W0_9EURY|nr:dCTP deaminase [Methanocaldococcus villosus]ENN95943.1 deoxycytidine triphosphate deaminase [Methanocaldococcus villosus KIN24-T80]
MILSDKDILKLINENKLIIEPFNREHLGPASYDVTLGNEFIVYEDEVYDLFNDLNYKRIKIKNSILICPINYNLTEEKIEYFKEKYNVDYVSKAILGTTNEYIELPNDITSFYQGRSSLGRLFLTSHQTAGFIDAGFRGKITLEIVAHDKPVILYPNMRIGQLIFFKLNSPAEIGYCEKKNSKYAYQRTVMPSLIKRDFIK